jgi:hypothetical protein
MRLNRGVGVLVIGFAVAGAIGCASDGSGPGGSGGTGGSSTGKGGTTGSGGSTGKGGTAGPGGASGSGGTGGTSATSGVTGTKRIDSLTTTEKQQLCDWTAPHFGGYGMSIDCGNGTTLSADPSQAYCVASTPTNCPMTVSAYETCVNDSSCADPLPASCAPLLSCS